MKSVFLIKTPLQLLNAIEARHYFNLKPSDCVLIVMGDRKSQPQLIILANKINQWRSVIDLNEISLFFGDPIPHESKSLLADDGFKSKILRKSFLYVRRLNRISIYLGKVDYIFIGHPWYLYMKHFLNVMPHNKAIVLDDGVGTIQITNARNKGLNGGEDFSTRKRLKLWGKRFFQGVNDKEKDSLGFFTIYDVNPGENDYVIKNRFEYFKSIVKLIPESDEVYFIGSPLSESGAIPQDQYLDQLKRVKNFFGDNKFVYISHRRESSEKLDIIKNNLNLNVISFDYPIEYQLAFIGPRPKMMVSFVSSALDSCRLIFGDNLKIVAFILDVTESPKREVIENIYNAYRSYESNGFSVMSDY